MRLESVAIRADLNQSPRLGVDSMALDHARSRTVAGDSRHSVTQWLPERSQNHQGGWGSPGDQSALLGHTRAPNALLVAQRASDGIAA